MLFRMSLFPNQNLTALMERSNYTKRELLSKVWMVSNTKSDKRIHQPENMMPIAIFYQFILVRG